LLRSPVAVSTTTSSSTLQLSTVCVVLRMGLRNLRTRSSIFLEARRPVEKMAISRPRTAAVKAAQYMATANVFPKRLGVTIMTSVLKVATSNSRASLAALISKESP
jgi:hypothetical protein